MASIASIGLMKKVNVGQFELLGDDDISYSSVSTLECKDRFYLDIDGSTTSIQTPNFPGSVADLRRRQEGSMAPLGEVKTVNKAH